VKNRPATQDAFFNIFNDLHNRHKQIVMASDRMPSDLEGLEKRLLSRFKWGLPAELFMPDIETRMKILKQKIVDNGIISIPDEVIEYIALVATTNIRELEGMLNSILARAILCKEPTAITLELAKSIIDNFVRNSEKEISIDYIKNIVCDYFTVPISEVFSKGRKREIVQARQLIMYFAKKHSNSSLQSIGLQCGNRDHATVLHACKTVTDLLDSDKNFKTYVDDLSRRINM
jgi:chromosomal replication initiator protein